MKLCIFADPHFCEAYSIIQKYGTKYTKRLENQLDSINWVEQIAIENGCDAVICLGDFFDHDSLTDQELTALKDIKWNELYHYFLVGNHESGEITLQYASTNALEAHSRIIISEPKLTISDDVEFCFLPYITESIRKPLTEYFPPRTNRKRVIFAHNDLCGVQLGPIISKLGFRIEEIEANCDLFLNGHLHNGQKITDKIINLGNLTGKDFGEDATKYEHGVFILDTDTLCYEFIENPHAYNFYRLECTTESDLAVFDTLKPGAVLSIKCVDTLAESMKEALKRNEAKVAESRIIVVHGFTAEDEAAANIADLHVDHLARFVDCCRANIDNSDILEAELAEVCK